MDRENTREREAYKMELNKRVENLLRSGIPTKDIADILDGEAFLSIQPQRGQQEPVTVFDVRGFVES